MLNSQWGLLNKVIWSLLQTDGPPRLDNATLARGSVIYAHIWKWLPFWTIILMAGRMAMPPKLMARAGPTSFATSPFPCSPASIWCARC